MCASSVTSMESIAASARMMRHCCSVRSCRRSDGRNCRITASRARSSDIGSERENSRIGTRWSATLAARDPLPDFFDAIGSCKFFGVFKFALQHENKKFDPDHLTC